MGTQETRRQWGLKPLGVAFLAILLLVVGFFAINYGQARALPADQAAVEEQLDRNVYAYFKLDGKGYVVTSLGDRVLLDQLVLDSKPMGVPPEPRWQWSGDWTTIAVTDEIASAAMGGAGEARVLFGQVNDPSIDSLEIKTSERDVTASANAPGYGVLLEDITGKVQQVRFLDDAGELVYVVEM